MAVTDDHVALVRAYLTGDRGEFERLLEQLGGGPAPALHLAYAVFVQVMKGQLSRDDLRAEIVRLVGDLRSRAIACAESIDPKLAEQVINDALGRKRESDEPLDWQAAHWMRMKLLRAMVVFRLLEPAELDDILNGARPLAELRLARKERGERKKSLTDQALWADLTEDEAAFQWSEDRFGPVDIAEYATLVLAALRLLAKRSCPNGGTRIEIVELVGDVRARSKWWADSVRPVPAERIVRHLLRQETLEGLDYLKSCETARLLLRALVIDQWPDDAELDELLANARELADRWMGRGGP